MTWNKETIKAFLTDYRTLLGLWLLLGAIAALCKLGATQHNNYLIFAGSFSHLRDGLTLYGAYPSEYYDVFLYGPVFALLIAPFAILPVWAGMVLWCVALAALLYDAVRRSTLSNHTQVFILWFCAHELLTALFMQQFNVAVVALLVFAFAMVERQKEHWAALAVVLGAMTKIYGIVGLCFWLFSQHKMRYIGWCVVWAMVLLAAPALVAGPEYVVDQYQAWWLALTGKNDINHLTLMQNISLLGLVRKTGYACAFGMPALREALHGATPIDSVWTRYSDLWVIVPGMLLWALPLVRYRQWQHPAFRQMLLASVLMFICLFSTGTESSGYIIALVGVAVWYAAVPWRRNRWDLGLLIFCFVLTSLSPSDLFPAVVRREWVQPLALKALPVVLIWLQLSVEMLCRDFADEHFFVKKA